MDIVTDKLTMTAMWEKNLGQHPDTRMFSYADPVEIACYISGEFLYIREGNSYTQVSAQKYTTQAPINETDKIDGQVVKRSNNTAGFDGEIESYQVYIW